MINKNIFLLSSVPENIDYLLFLKSALGKPFCLYHDFNDQNTYLILDEKDSIESFSNSNLGLNFKKSTFTVKGTEFLKIVPYYEVSYDEKHQPEQKFKEIYDILGNTNNSFFIFFIPSEINYTKEIKKKIEEILSSTGVRVNRQSSQQNILYGKNESVQSELLYNSGERLVLSSVLNMLNEIILSNGISYMPSIFISKDNIGALSYLKSKIMFSEESNVKINDNTDIFLLAKKFDGIPMSEKRAALAIIFSNTIPKSSAIQTFFADIYGDISLGNYLENSIVERKKAIKIERNALNLGMFISGVPGTGKTSSTMSILKQILNNNRPYTVILSPTSEWNSFAKELNIQIIQLYSQTPKLSFFNCNKKINPEYFYENMAMLISSASNAGPYKNAMEKCLLSAFSKIYSVTKTPEPEDVYDSIFEKVVERHGKRSGTGIKLTKHGENIIAALEPMRLMLHKKQFAYSDGLDIETIIKNGVVFDLSKVSNSMKPFYYALLLNQIYMLAELFDTEGDKELRMAICIEEAQIIFGDDDSAASFDILQRIQDFRKKGIGLVLITHNVSDIKTEIRRLCQLKVYFRQSPDTARFAVNDLLFKSDQLDSLIDKLKTLDQGVCAVTPIKNVAESRQPVSSIFIKANKYLPIKANKNDEYSFNINSEDESTLTSIKLVNKELIPLIGRKLSIFYCGEEIFQGVTDSFGCLTTNSILINKKCILTVQGEKKKDSKSFKIIGGKENRILLE